MDRRDRDREQRSRSPKDRRTDRDRDRDRERGRGDEKKSKSKSRQGSSKNKEATRPKTGRGTDKDKASGIKMNALEVDLHGLQKPELERLCVSKDAEIERLKQDVAKKKQEVNAANARTRSAQQENRADRVKSDDRERDRVRAGGDQNHGTKDQTERAARKRLEKQVDQLKQDLKDEKRNRKEEVQKLQEKNDKVEQSLQDVTKFVLELFVHEQGAETVRKMLDQIVDENLIFDDDTPDGAASNVAVRSGFSSNRNLDTAGGGGSARRSNNKQTDQEEIAEDNKGGGTASKRKSHIKESSAGREDEEGSRRSEARRDHITGRENTSDRKKQHKKTYSRSKSRSRGRDRRRRQHSEKVKASSSSVSSRRSSGRRKNRRRRNDPASDKKKRNNDTAAAGSSKRKTPKMSSSRTSTKKNAVAVGAQQSDQDHAQKRTSTPLQCNNPGTARTPAQAMTSNAERGRRRNGGLGRTAEEQEDDHGADYQQKLSHLQEVAGHQKHSAGQIAFGAAAAATGDHQNSPFFRDNHHPNLSVVQPSSTSSSSVPMGVTTVADRSLLNKATASSLSTEFHLQHERLILAKEWAGGTGSSHSQCPPSFRSPSEDFDDDANAVYPPATIDLADYSRIHPPSLGDIQITDQPQCALVDQNAGGGSTTHQHLIPSIPVQLDTCKLEAAVEKNKVILLERDAAMASDKEVAKSGCTREGTSGGLATAPTTRRPSTNSMADVLQMKPLVANNATNKEKPRCERGVDCITWKYYGEGKCSKYHPPEEVEILNKKHTEYLQMVAQKVPEKCQRLHRSWEQIQNNSGNNGTNGGPRRSQDRGRHRARTPRGDRDRSRERASPRKARKGSDYSRHGRERDRRRRSRSLSTSKDRARSKSSCRSSRRR
ncbi:unnamed protein product [Amoebophrya sp. A120]|nr:unnamed protein product [Amoebophrya sp. A120]|eukprot:GSA120T00001683001.1